MSDHKPKTAQYYLLDLGSLLKQQALAAKTGTASDGRRDDFEVGRLMAYHEVISLMQEQANTFGFPLEEPQFPRYRS